MSYQQGLFLNTFAPAEFEAFRAGYEGINPSRPLETAGVWFQEMDCSGNAVAYRAHGIGAERVKGNPKNPRLTVEGYPAGARTWFVATKA